MKNLAFLIQFFSGFGIDKVGTMQLAAIVECSVPVNWSVTSMKTWYRKLVEFYTMVVLQNLKGFYLCVGLFVFPWVCVFVCVYVYVFCCMTWVCVCEKLWKLCNKVINRIHYSCLRHSKPQLAKIFVTRLGGY